MESFCYHRDRPGSLALRRELLEEHWSYMDRYAKELTARGPTTSPAAVPVATGTWCSASARGGPPISPYRTTGTS